MTPKPDKVTTVLPYMYAALPRLTFDGHNILRPPAQKQTPTNKPTKKKGARISAAALVCLKILIRT